MTKYVMIAENKQKIPLGNMQERIHGSTLTYENQVVALRKVFKERSSLSH